MKSVVQSMQKPIEKKYFDQVQGLNPTQSGTIINISDITRGAEVTQRIGNETFLKHIEFRFAIFLNTNVSRASVRYMILVDTQGYNAPAVTDVLEPALVGTAYTDVSYVHWDYRKRFIIKKDKVTTLVKGGPNEYAFEHFNVQLNMKSYNIGASTTFKNHVYLLVIGTESNVLNYSTFNYTSRLVFTDE